MAWDLLGFRGLWELLNLHPLVVHFPIVLFPTAVFFYALGVLGRRATFLPAARLCLGLAWGSAVFAVWTGTRAEGTFPHSPALHRMMETHEALGFTVVAAGTVLLLWSRIARDGVPRTPRLFLVACGLTLCVLLQNADLGARMVYVEGAAVKVVPAPSAPHAHDHAHPAAPESAVPAPPPDPISE